MTISDKVNRIEEAINLIMEAQQVIDDVLNDEFNGSQIKANYEAYGKYGFNQLLGNGNPHDSSLYSIIERLREVEEFEDDDEPINAIGDGEFDQPNPNLNPEPRDEYPSIKNLIIPKKW